MTFLDDMKAKEDELDLQALSSVLRTTEGRRFIRRLLTEARLYEFSPRGLDPQAMVYRAAQRDFGLLVVAMIADVDPRAFANLTREAAEDAERLKAKMMGDPDDI
jgi:phage baseplate assembly protein W